MKTKKIATLIFVAVLVFVLYKMCVLHIVFDGIVQDERAAFREIVLPQNALPVRETGSQSELLKQSLFLTVPLIIGFILYVFIGKKKGWFIPSKKGLITGMFASFLLQGFHEILHGIAFPAGSTVYIGIIASNFSGYASSNAAMSMLQCIIYHLLPAFVLGVVPLALFLLDREKRSAFCWFCLGFALIGLIQTAPDWFGLYPILSQVPWNAVIQMSGWHTYWYV